MGENQERIYNTEYCRSSQRIAHMKASCRITEHCRMPQKYSKGSRDWSQDHCLMNRDRYWNSVDFKTTLEKYSYYYVCTIF